MRRLLVCVFFCGAIPLFGDTTTALMEALSDGELGRAGVLLDHGADLNVRDSQGRNAAFFAFDAFSEYTGKVTPRQIMDFAESRGLRFDVIDNAGYSPLMYEIGKIKECSGAEALLNWEEKYSPNFSAGRESRKDYYTDLLGLHLSGHNWEFPLLDRLLQGGASAAARDKDGVPVVLRISWLHSNHAAIVRRLIDLGAPVNELDKRGYSLLMHAVSMGDDEMTEFLIQHGAQVNQQGRSGAAPLQFAKTERVVSLLLEAGADAAHTDNAGNTALHYWLQHENKQILEMLLAAGCPLDAPNIDGFTPLMYAAREGEGNEVLALLEKGADPNSKDTKGQSVLLHYVQTGEDATEPVVAALLAAGARPEDTDNKGVSALLYAMRLSKSTWADYAEEMGIFYDIMRRHVSKEEIAAVEGIVAAEERERLSGAISRNKELLTSLLLWGGLSVTMREVVFRDNKSNNFMGTVNAMLTLGSAGFFLGGGLGAGLFYSSLDTTLGGAFVGACLGTAGGIIAACLPPVRKAFAENALLYYIPPAAGLTITFTIVLD